MGLYEKYFLGKRLESGKVYFIDPYSYLSFLSIIMDKSVK